MQRWFAIAALVGLLAAVVLTSGDFIVPAIFTVLYLLPAGVAYYRRSSLKQSVAVVNIFLGWTLVGWVVALAMAVKEPKRVEV